MFCPKCGCQNEDGSKFCKNCAKPLAQEIIEGERDKDITKKLFSAHILNIVAAVVLLLSYFLIQYGVSTSTGGVESHSSVNGTITSSTSTTVQFDTSGADDAYTAIGVGVAVAVVGLLVYFLKNSSAAKGLSYVYLIGALIAICLQFMAGIKTISFTCGLGFVITISGILQIVAGIKFVSAFKGE